MIELEERGKPLTAAEMVKFEEQHGISLPQPYRDFLMHNNGGYPVPDAFKFHGSATGSSVDAFYGLSGPPPRRRLGYALEIYKERLPEGFLPIAYDPFGNVICIQYKGPGTGRVYFWDHEQEADEGEQPTMENMRLIGESFEEFIAGLYEFEG